MNQNLTLVYYALSLARIDVFQPGDKLALTKKSEKEGIFQKWLLEEDCKNKISKFLLVYG